MLHGGRGLTLLSVSESQIVLPELVVQKLELLQLSSSGAATTKKPPRHSNAIAGKIKSDERINQQGQEENTRSKIVWGSEDGEKSK